MGFILLLEVLLQVLHATHWTDLVLLCVGQMNQMNQSVRGNGPLRKIHQQPRWCKAKCWIFGGDHSSRSHVSAELVSRDTTRSFFYIILSRLVVSQTALEDSLSRGRRKWLCHCRKNNVSLRGKVRMIFLGEIGEIWFSEAPGSSPVRETNPPHAQHPPGLHRTRVTGTRGPGWDTPLRHLLC